MTLPLVLVVADAYDAGARAVARAATRPLGPVVWVGGDDLAAARWSHTIGADGRTATRLRLGGSTSPALTDDDVALVWFRSELWQVPGALRGADPADVGYARSELLALMVSWLSSLGSRVVNAVDGTGLVGPSWSQPRWRQAAAEAGLPVAGQVSATAARLVPGWTGSAWDAQRPPGAPHPRPVSTLLLTGSRVTGPLAKEHAAAGRRLAAASGCRVLQLGFDRAGAVCSVTPNPPLTTEAEVASAAALLLELAA